MAFVGVAVLGVRRLGVGVDQAEVAGTVFVLLQGAGVRYDFGFVDGTEEAVGEGGGANVLPVGSVLVANIVVAEPVVGHGGSVGVESYHDDGFFGYVIHFVGEGAAGSEFGTVGGDSGEERRHFVFDLVGEDIVFHQSDIVANDCGCREFAFCDAGRAVGEFETVVGGVVSGEDDAEVLVDILCGGAFVVAHGDAAAGSGDYAVLVFKFAGGGQSEVHRTVAPVAADI